MRRGRGGGGEEETDDEGQEEEEEEEERRKVGGAEENIQDREDRPQERRRKPDLFPIQERSRAFQLRYMRFDKVQKGVLQECLFTAQLDCLYRFLDTQGVISEVFSEKADNFGRDARMVSESKETFVVYVIFIHACVFSSFYYLIYIIFFMLHIIVHFTHQDPLRSNEKPVCFIVLRVVKLVRYKERNNLQETTCMRRHRGLRFSLLMGTEQSKLKTARLAQGDPIKRHVWELALGNLSDQGSNSTETRKRVGQSRRDSNSTKFPGLNCPISGERNVKTSSIPGVNPPSQTCNPRDHTFEKDTINKISCRIPFEVTINEFRNKLAVPFPTIVRGPRLLDLVKARQL
ncbi:hypothetical protein WN51_08755 [Melipona quadrifasciata]|uniref:Uncharacterized protein n=1 Tax=Melipona quadrifasciata TaxID=166423 RepID=A0A0N1IT01_9HYME|nr:hypothetical protein WN51_08755 [Melipona quadrifasciata]